MNQTQLHHHPLRLTGKRRFGALGLGLLVGALVLGGPARAATLYWDANAGGSGTGGSGNWNTNDVTWRLGSTGGGLQAWANGENANLPTTAGTLTLTENITVGENATVSQLIPFVAGYTINATAGNSLTLDIRGGSGNYRNTFYGPGLAMVVNAPVVLAKSVEASATTRHGVRGVVTLNGVVSEDLTGATTGQGFRLNNAGTSLTLNQANTFTGGVYLEGNTTLVIGHDQAVGSGALDGFNSVGAALAATNGHRTISNAITPTAGNPFILTTVGANNLTLAGGVGTGTLGGSGLTFSNNNPVLTVNRPLYTYATAGANTFTKTGTGTLVLNHSSHNDIGGTAINLNDGGLLINGDTVGASTLNGTVVNGSPVISGLSSTAGLRVGQEITAGLSFGTLLRRVIVSIDSPTQVTLGEPITSASGTYSVTFGAVGGLGYNSGNFTVSSTATLGGHGTLALGSGKIVTINGGTITPGMSVGTFTINGAMAFTNAPSYVYEAEDLVDVNGTLTLPEEQWNIELIGSVGSSLQAGGSLVLFTFDSLANPGTYYTGALNPTYTNWDHPLPTGNLYVSILGNSVILNGVSFVIPEPSTIFLLACGGWLLVKKIRNPKFEIRNKSK